MKKPEYLTLVFFLVLLGPLFLHAQKDKDHAKIILEDDGDVQLRIDFTTGSQITNEPPVLLKPLPDISMIENAPAPLITPLDDFFTDPENGANLKFQITLSDSSLIAANLHNHSLELLPQPKKTGTTTVIVSASDNILHVTDTFTVEIKKKLILNQATADITLRKGQQIAHSIKLNRLFDKSYPYADYSYDIYISDSIVVSAEIDADKGRLVLSAAERADGICDVFITITDPDSQMISDTFSVAVIKRSYDAAFDPGISLYTGLDYSGLESRFWIRKIIGFGLGVYTFWNMEGFGGEVSLRGKFPLKSKVLPYINISGGYHFQKVPKYQSNSQALSEISFPTVSASLGAEIRPGKSGLHGISIEAGYRYGTADFYYTSLTDPHYQDENLIGNYTMNPTLLKLIYSFYFRGITNRNSGK